MILLIKIALGLEQQDFEAKLLEMDLIKLGGHIKSIVASDNIFKCLRIA